LTMDLQSDQRAILEHVIRILQGLVDVVSANSMLKQSLHAMELSQMCVQALSHKAPLLLQLPHIDEDLCTTLKDKYNVESVFDLNEMEDADRNQAFEEMNARKMEELASACNRYPYVQLNYSLLSSSENPNKTEVRAGEEAKVMVTLQKDEEDEKDADKQSVVAPYFPREKDESWWLVLGEVGTNTLLAIKRLSFNKQEMRVNLVFEVGEDRGPKKYNLYLMCDSYLGADQDHTLEITVI